MAKYALHWEPFSHSKSQKEILCDIYKSSDDKVSIKQAVPAVSGQYGALIQSLIITLSQDDLWISLQISFWDLGFVWEKGFLILRLRLKINLAEIFFYSYLCLFMF